MRRYFHAIIVENLKDKTITECDIYINADHVDVIDNRDRDGGFAFVTVVGDSNVVYKANYICDESEMDNSVFPVAEYDAADVGF